MPKGWSLLQLEDDTSLARSVLRLREEAQGQVSTEAKAAAASKVRDVGGYTEHRAGRAMDHGGRGLLKDRAAWEAE